jgi:hypothetical protein
MGNSIIPFLLTKMIRYMTLMLKKYANTVLTQSYNRTNNSISFMSVVATTSDHLHCELVHILFLQTNL